jgi:hypothetical protein
MEQYVEGLRCQDVHAGLRSVDPNSPGLIPLKTTRLVGMAADGQALVRHVAPIERNLPVAVHGGQTKPQVHALERTDFVSRVLVVVDPVAVAEPAPKRSNWLPTDTR